MSKPKILIVDDDIDFVEINKTILEKANYEVVTAYSGKEGMEKAKREKPNLIILDVMMTDRTEGFYTSRELRQDFNLKGIPIIMLTSIHQFEKSFRFAPDETWLPVDVFLDKPLKPEKLLEEVNRWLKKRPLEFEGK